MLFGENQGPKVALTLSLWVLVSQMAWQITVLSGLGRGSLCQKTHIEL